MSRPDLPVSDPSGILHTRRDSPAMTSTSSAARRGARTRRRPAPLDVALWAASRGWFVFPLTPGTKLPARSCDDCSSASLDYDGHDAADCPHPAAGLHCHGMYAATVDEHVIRSWWAENPRYNVGVHAGRSDLVILDLDRHQDKKRPRSRDLYLPGVELPAGLDVEAELHDGVDVVAQLAAIRGHESPLNSPATLIVTTPSGGLHLWYRAPEGTRWSRGVDRLGWQVDVLAGASIAIMPGTVTSVGTYTRTSATALPTELPTWLGEDLERVGLREDNRPEPPAAAPTTRSTSAVPSAAAEESTRLASYLERAVRNELEKIDDAQEGGWNQAIYTASLALGRLVGGGYLEEAAVEADLLAAAAPRTQQDHRSAAATIRSGLRNGIKRPRKVELK